MQKCSLCGGRVVNGRCEDCGLPIPPEHSYTLRGESAHYHRVNGEDVLHRVRPAGNRPKVEGYDDEERTAHVHESGTDRHNAPRPAVRTARVEHHIEAPSRRRRSANVAWLIIVVALFLILPMLQVLLQREIGSSVSEPVPEFSEEQAIEADSNAYDDLRPLVSAGGHRLGRRPARRAVRRGAGPARGHLHDQVRRGRHVHGDAPCQRCLRCGNL